MKLNTAGVRIFKYVLRVDGNGRATSTRRLEYASPSCDFARIKRRLFRSRNRFDKLDSIIIVFRQAAHVSRATLCAFASVDGDPNIIF